MNLYAVMPPSTTATSSTALPSSSGDSSVSPADLRRATFTNANFTTGPDGQAFLNMAPPPGGSASVEVTPGSLWPPPAAGSECTVSLSYRTLPPAGGIQRRGLPTQCTLTIFLGGALVYSAPLYTTDGNYTTVSTVATFPGGPVTTLIINEYCAGNAPTLSIGDVGVGPGGGGSSSSSTTHSSTTSTTVGSSSSQTSTFITWTVSSSSSTSSSLPTTSSWATSTVSATTSPWTRTIATLTDVNTVNAALVTAPAYTAGTCNRGNPYATATGDNHPACWLTGFAAAPSPMAVATAAAPNRQQLNPDFEICAGLCAGMPTCKSWVLDTGSNWPDSFACLFYDFRSQEWLAQAPYQYNHMYVWMDKSCWDCNSDSTVTSSTSTASSSPPTTLSSTPSSTSNTITSTTISSTATSSPLTTGTSTTPASTFANSCTKSNAYLAVNPTFTPTCAKYVGDLPPPMAVLTNISVSDTWPPSNSYAECAGYCANTWGCKAFVLNFNGQFNSYPWIPPPSYTCHLFNLDGQHFKQQGGSFTGRFTGPVWLDMACYNCVNDWTTASAGYQPFTITTPPPAFTTSLPPAGSRTCDVLDDYGGKMCEYSGMLLPTGPRPLLAVATGLPVPARYYDSEEQVNECAALCQDTPGCSAWTIDRNPTGTYGAPWTCYIYGGSFSARLYADEYSFFRIRDTDSDDRGDYFMWNDAGCFSCLPGSTTTSSTVTSTSSTSQTSSQATITGAPTVTAPPLGQRTCILDDEQTTARSICSGSRPPLPPTATYQPILVATGMPPEPRWLQDEAQVQDCAGLCQDTPGCGSWVLDRGASWSGQHQPATWENWTCMLYGEAFDLWNYWIYVVPWHSPDFNSTPSERYLWSDRDCYACNNLTASTTSTTASTTSSSTTTTSSTATPPPTPCTRAPNPDLDRLACNLRGFAQPDIPYAREAPGHTPSTCAALCLSINQVFTSDSCTAWYLDATVGKCFMYDSLSVWDALGQTARVGASYRNNVMDDMGCWNCTGT
jgi:hypothetical protein